MTKTYEIRTTDWQLNSLNGRTGSKTELEGVVRDRLDFFQRGRGVASTWPDGTRAFYQTRADMARDTTGEHAIAIVTVTEAD